MVRTVMEADDLIVMHTAMVSLMCMSFDGVQIAKNRSVSLMRS